MSDFLIVFIIVLSYFLFFFFLPHILRFVFWFVDKCNISIGENRKDDSTMQNKKED